MNFGKVLLVFMLCLFCLMGCAPSENKENPQLNVEEKANENETETTGSSVKNIVSTELPNMTGWSEVSHYIGDIDGDGIDEKVFLMTSAERDLKGEIVWNDGQKWVLYVEKGELHYVLLNQYIQTGNVYFEVLDYYNENGAEPKINTIISTSSGFCVNSYSFINEEKVFKQETVYDTSLITMGGTNRRFSSIPEME